MTEKTNKETEDVKNDVEKMLTSLDSSDLLIQFMVKVQAIENILLKKNIILQSDLQEEYDKIILDITKSFEK